MLKGKRSFFTELLISFLLLLCIPIITILLILWQSNRIVKAQVQDIESKSLHLYVEQLEEVMGGMKEICHTLYSSEYCKMYASVNEVRDAWAYDLRTRIDGKENSYLSMTMGVRNKKSLNSNFTVCVVLSPEYLEQLLVMQKANEDSIFQVYNTEKNLIFSNNSVLEHLSRRKGNNLQGATKSEFLHIMSFMENQERVLKEKNKISREWFLHGLLEGKDKKVSDETLEENNIFFISDRFLVCIIHAEGTLKR